MPIIATTLFSVVSILSGFAQPINPMVPDSPFDQYGVISWHDEKARLDNFAIQLQTTDEYVGYILMVEANGGCPGEAQARAIRAKKYLVEHRNIPVNRVIWRIEGYDEELSTMFLVVPLGVGLEHGIRGARFGKAGPTTETCKLKLKRIKNSRW